MHHVGQGVARFGHDIHAVLNRQTRLVDNPAFHHFPVLHRRLAGNVQPASRFHRPRERQVLPAGTGTALYAITFNTHFSLLISFGGAGNAPRAR